MGGNCRLVVNNMVPGTYRVIISHNGPTPIDAQYVLDTDCQLIQRTWWNRPVVPDGCDGLCDAYKVMVRNVHYEYEDVCIIYHVERIVDSGYYCNDNIQHLVLGLCDGDSYGRCNDVDLNGLIRSFRIIDDWYNDDWYNGDIYWSNGARRLSQGTSPNNIGKMTFKENQRKLTGYSGKRRYSRKYSKYSWGTYSDKKMYGVMIDVDIAYDAMFEVCLTNVFREPLEFSRSVRFRRGYNKYTCSHEWVMGLPCLDTTRFVTGSYDYSGYNIMGQRYKRIPRKYRRKHRVEIAGVELSDITELETSPIVRWEVLSCIILFSFCVIGVCIYCMVLRRKRQKNMDRVKSYDGIKNENENDNEEEEESQDGNGGNVTDTKHTKTRKFKKTQKSHIEMQDISDSEKDGFINESESDTK